MAWVLDALASYVQNMITEMARDEVHMLQGVTGEIQKMDITLKDLKYFLMDADRRSITDQSVQAWVLELREAMYDATNILDICQLKAMEQGPSHDAGCFNPLLSWMRNPNHAHKIGSRIKNLNQRLEDIKKRSLAFNFINLNSYEDRIKRVATYHPGSCKTSSDLDESNLVGENIEEDTRNLVEMLTSAELSKCENNKILVFAIVGAGGIGKTTLAKKVFNNEIIQQEFTKKIWLSVNQDFSETELLRRAIIEAGGDHQSTGNTRGALERALKEALNGQKTLLVMDDVWNHQVWEDVLQTPLVSAALAHGSRVLITTRHDMVARGMMATKPYHYVYKLAPKDAWLLLKKKVVGNGNDEVQIELLKDIGMEIITKCDGSPLAVKVMGGLLRQKTARRQDWVNVLNDSIWSVSQMPEELNYAIYLSYEALSPNLKPCFLHYSLLPKSRVFFTDDIIAMWISEGFVHGTSRDLEEIGKEYYNELIQRNLIEPDLDYVDQEVFSMHDVVRSFAQYMARNEALVVAQNRKIDIAAKINSQKFFRLSLETGGSESDHLEWYSLQPQASLRTLLSVGDIKIKPGDSLLVFPKLRALHVQDASFDTLAESLNQLEHLRYLSIIGTNTSRLPKNIGNKMKLLQYVNLYGCKSLVNLPSSFVTLQHLRFLHLMETGITSIPKGFHGLTNLRILYGFPAHMNGDRCSLEELGPLSQLTRLSINGLENVPSSSFVTKAMIVAKVRLNYLALECRSRIRHDDQLVQDEQSILEEQQRQIEEVFNELHPPSGLETLGIRGYFGQRLPRWMMSTTVLALGCLKILLMDDLASCTKLPNGLCQLPCLEILQINHAPMIKHVGPEFLEPSHHCLNHSQVGVPFPRLSELNFSGLVEWEEWEWELQVKAMPILEELTLKKCMLRHIPPGLAFYARALKKLHIYDVKHLRSLENFASVVHLEVLGNTELERISNVPKLQKLVIINCKKVKVLEGMPALQRLELEDYEMETVPRYLQDVTPRHLLLDCSLSLLTSIAAGRTGPEWDKFRHIQQIKAYADDESVLRKWYVLYSRYPFRLETNISRSVVAQGRIAHTWFPYSKTCTIEDEWLVRRRASVGQCQPLCQRFKWQAYAHLVPWLHQSCLHCNEANRIASTSDEWTEAAVYSACTQIIPRKRYLLYTRDPFRSETNTSCSAIAKASTAPINFKFYACWKMYLVEDEWQLGQRVPLPPLEGMMSSSEGFTEALVSSSLGAMGPLLRKLDLLLVPDQYPLWRPLKHAIVLLKEDLVEICDTLVEHSMGDSPNHKAKYWMHEVRELLYDVEDSIDTMMSSHTTAEGRIVRHVHSYRVGGRFKIRRLDNMLKPSTGIVRIAELRTLLREAMERHERYQLDGCISKPRFVLSGRSSRVPLACEVVGNLVGIDGSRNELTTTKWLTDQADQQLKVLCIVGPAGVGKTTLAKKLYREPGGQFECRAFIRVSRNPDISRLLQALFYQIQQPKQNSKDVSVQGVIDNIRKHLQDKRYFIVIDDLWEPEAWDIIKIAFPKGNNCSRVIITGEVENIAAGCSGYHTVDIFELKPLGSQDSEKLFFDRALSSEDHYPGPLKDLSCRILKECGGLPLAIITVAALFASLRDNPDMWQTLMQFVLSSLENLSLEDMLKEIVDLCFNNLPQELKTCLQYLTMYPVGCTIQKDDLLKQWTAEGFITSTQGNEGVADSCFNELVKRGMLQPEKINYNNEVISCTVHHIVHDLITHKAREENFITTVDYSRTIAMFFMKARRLSLHYSCAQYATKPEGIMVSQVRSLAFFGLTRCMPSIIEFKLLRVLILEFWGNEDDDSTSINLSRICRLCLLRYLRISSHIYVELPSEIQGLKLLEILEIDARISVVPNEKVLETDARESAVPNDIVHLPGLLHLSLQDGTKLPNQIGLMTSLQTLKYFDLGNNSEDNVQSLGELINLRDLHLTCSTEVSHEHLKRSLITLGSSLGRLANLKSLTLAHGAVGMTMFVDHSSAMFSTPMFLQRLELPPICIFSRLPEWIGKLHKLCILKIAVRVLLKSDIDILTGLPDLGVLSLYVRQPNTECVVFNSGALPVLKYFKFRCSALCIAFREEALPNLRRLKVCFNVHRGQMHSHMISGVEHLLDLKEIAVRIGAADDVEESDRMAVESAFESAIQKHPRFPIYMNVKRVDWVE